MTFMAQDKEKPLFIIMICGGCWRFVFFHREVWLRRRRLL